MRRRRPRQAGMVFFFKKKGLGLVGAFTYYPVAGDSSEFPLFAEHVRMAVSSVYMHQYLRRAGADPHPCDTNRKDPCLL